MPALMLANYIESAASLPNATLTNVAQVREYEAVASEHWIFSKGNAAGLVGLKGGGVLTDAGAAKTWNAKSVTIPVTLGSRFDSVYADRLTRTECAVVKVPATGGTLGTFVFSTNGTTATGGVNMAIQASTSNDVMSRAIIAGAINQQSWNAANLTVGAWLFVALTIDHTGANRLRRFTLGDVHQTFTDSAAFTPHATYKLGLGTTANDFANGAPMEFAEYMVFADLAPTTVELDKIRRRSQARLLRQSGIVVT